MLHVYNDKISEEIQEANFLPVIVGEISNGSNTLQMALIY